METLCLECKLLDLTSEDEQLREVPLESQNGLLQLTELVLRVIRTQPQNMFFFDLPSLSFLKYHLTKYLFLLLVLVFVLVPVSVERMFRVCL
jgi:hypothetical protein